MSTLELKELSHPAGEVIKIAAGKTLDLNSQGSTILPTGSVLQVIHGSSATGVASSTLNTFVGSGCTATITPKFSNSKILVIGNLSINLQLTTSATDSQANTGIKRGSTIISGLIGYDELRNYINLTSTSKALAIRVPLNFLDSPSTTSATTYELLGSLRIGTQIYMQMNAQPSTITLMEVAG